MRNVAICVSSALVLGALVVPATPAHADLDSAMAAYERQDFSTAAQEFRRLADQGDASAQFMLGEMYASGRGLVQDFVEAHRWFNLAAAHGHTDALEARVGLEQRMTAEQVAEAQRLAAQFVPDAATSERAAPTPAEPDPGELVAGVQRALNERGYDAGPADGVLGPKTRSAIEQYQTDAGLAVTGAPSAALAERLGIAGADQELDLAAPDVAGRPQTWPWRNLLARDNFQDGDFTEDPSWVVAAGRFFIGPGNNLRSEVEVRESPDTGAGAGETDFGQVAAAVLGAVLQGGLGEGQVGPIDAPETAEIYLPQEITEAFAIELDLRVVDDAGGVALGPYRGTQREGGYRLIYLGGDEQRLELRELVGGSSTVLDSHSGAALAEGGVTSLLWTQAPDGPMVVHLDGREIMRVDEPPASEPFAGFTMQNLGGDHALHQIAIHGTS